MLSLLGQVVQLSRAVSKDGKMQMIHQPAFVLGFDPGGDERPSLHLGFLHEDRAPQLSGSDWRLAFDRAISVPHASRASDPMMSSYSFGDARDAEPVAPDPIEPEAEKSEPAEPKPAQKKRAAVVAKAE